MWISRRVMDSIFIMSCGSYRGMPLATPKPPPPVETGHAPSPLDAAGDAASRFSTENQAPQPANTASLRPTLPAGTGHFRARRAHSQAHSVLRQTPAGTAHDSFPARLAPAYASSRRPSIRRSPLAHRYARDIRTAPSEHPPAPLRPALTSSTTTPPVGRWADHPAMATM